MCAICAGIEEGVLTFWEARINYVEMRAHLEPEHREELEKKLFSETIYNKYKWNYGTRGSD